MASLKKKYQERMEAGPRPSEPPVVTAPTGAAKLPDAVADPKPPEMPETTESPADVAAKTALKQRLQEMERAETLNKQAAEPPPRAAEPQQPQMPAMPAHVQKWLSEHPEYCDPNDHVAQAEIYTATLKCNRDRLTWDAPDFLPALEGYLGIAPRGNGQVQHRPASPVNAPPAPRYEAPPRQQQRSAVPMSAPPTREVPSMASGRLPSRRVPLTQEQREAARFQRAGIRAAIAPDGSDESSGTTR